MTQICWDLGPNRSIQIPAGIGLVLQELQPGLYSMHFSHATSQSPITAQVQQHCWHDPLLCAIRDVHRPQALVTPLQLSSAARKGGEGSLHHAERPYPADNKFQPPSTPLDDSISREHGNADMISTGCAPSMPEVGVPAEQSFDRAVDLTLTALAKSVAVRCQCIDQHSPHQQNVPTPVAPDTAFASAADAGGQSAHGNSTTGDRDDKHEAGLLQPAAIRSVQQQQERSHEHRHTSNLSNLASHPPSATSKDEYDQLSAQAPQQPGVPQQHLPAQPAALQHPSIVQPRLHTHSVTGKQIQPSANIPVQQRKESTMADLQPAPVLILFSGGVDSTLIAALAHQALPIDVPIDLASVCFNRGKSADRLAALDALQELAAFAPAREWRLIQVDSSLEEVDEHKQWLLGAICNTASLLWASFAANHKQTQSAAVYACFM